MALLEPHIPSGDGARVAVHEGAAGGAGALAGGGIVQPGPVSTGTAAAAASRGL